MNYLEQNESIILRKGYEWIGNATAQLTREEQFGEVDFGRYKRIYEMIIYLRALQTDALTEWKQREPIVKRISDQVENYPSTGVPLKQP